jgi:NTP pyrophosphatase (non-canonical NTP hydrolase)
MTYYLYHVPGKKIGVTCSLKHRVEEQQGYKEGEYEVILQTDDISLVSEAEISLQKAYGYRVDRQLYKDLYKNNFKQLNNMNINITEQTTTFPCPVNKLKGQLMDNKGLRWMTEHGEFMITDNTIKWILSNVKESMYDKQRCYVYNKAFARFYDNNDAYSSNGTLADAHMQEKYTGDQYDGKTIAGGLMNDRLYDKDEYECCDKDNPCTCKSQFDLIREWADERGLYEHGDPKTQSLKLVEEVGEICRAVLKDDIDEVIDGIGDAVVVLTNLAELHDVSIEECIASAYGVISKRTGKMVNGTFKKD